MNVLDRFQAFLDVLGEPKPEKPPIIPTRWRMPFFVGLALASLALLALFAWFVVLPAIHSQQPTIAPATSSVSKP